jgi:DNA-binding XRE family transcriptional regulator
MRTNELLEKHPLTTEVVRTWFFDQMTASFSDENVPEEFKEMMKQEGVTNERLATFIDVQPRTLFDVFDENDIVIETSLYPNGEFTIKIGNEATTNSWKTRKEAELFAIEAAFELLEERLKPIELPSLEEN